MKWTEAKDIILCKEVALQNPFQFRRGSLERGKVWSGVATELRKQSFKVDQRAVRDRYNSLKNKVQKNNSQDKRASGISPEETESQRELRVLLEDLANQEDDAELLPKTNASEEEQRRLDGQEVQKRACESFVETRKRHFADKENMPRKRNSGSDALQFLHQKMELEREMRKEELAMRRAEVKRDEAERDRRFELFQQQQQQTQQQFMQQQQQMQQHLAQQQQQMQNMLMMFMQSMKGRDLQEDRVGGTWLGVSQSGRVAFLLNYFQLSGPDPEAKGRGSLVKDFILGDASPEAYTTLVSKEGSLYNPFNLICIEFRHSKCDAFYYSNKTGEHPTRIEPGVHGCSNSAFDKPWPKASHVKSKLNEVVSSTSEETEVIQKLFDVFHNDQRLDGEDSLQLDKASLETNQELFSKILPNLIMVNTPVYGTRSTTVVLVKDNNEAIYVEKYLEEPIDPANYQWKTKEHRFTLRENLTLKL